MSELIGRQAALDALCDACTLASVKSECIFKTLESCMDHNAILDVPTAGREWLHDLLQDAIDAGIITETQASRLMDRIAEGNT